MNNKSFLFLPFLLIIACSSCSEKTDHRVKAVSQISDSLKQIYAPDSRVERIEIDISSANNKILLKGITTNPDFKAALFNRLDSLDYTYLDSLTVLPTEQADQKNWALVNISVANLRGKPGHSQEMVTQATMGTPLRVLLKDGGWYLVQTPDKYLSWAESAAISLKSDSELSAWKASDRMIFLGDFGVIRELPGEESPAVSDLVFGSIISKKGNAGKYLEISLPDGRSGFLQGTDLEYFYSWASQVRPEPEKFENLGYNLIGRPYLWGGTSTKGFDCSGFVKTLYYSGGIILSRDASQQVLQGDDIKTDNGFGELQKGDLVFFGRKANGDQKERITHVGMYIGEGKYIHASGRVKINSFLPDDELFSDYLLNIFVKAKKIIDCQPENAPVSIDNHPWYQ